MISTTINLISETVSVNSLRMETVAETSTTVFAELQSISQSEYFAAQNADLNPEHKFIVFAGDYNGEKIISYGGERFSVYRTYQNGDRMELYAERKAGSNG